MAIPVLIIGESGSGKSASLRNFQPNQVGIINVAGKPLPFRKKLPTFNTSDFAQIKNMLFNSKCSTIVIDDAQYLMAFMSFTRAKERGYDKFTDMAVAYNDLIQFIIRQLPPEKIVYIMQHSDTDQLTGKMRAKTLGKMIDNQLTLEGLFTIVLFTYTDGKKHVFLTQSDGTNTAKSPMEMFDSVEIDNDLCMVDAKIREYYELPVGGVQNG